MDLNTCQQLILSLTASSSCSLFLVCLLQVDKLLSIIWSSIVSEKSVPDVSKTNFMFGSGRDCLAKNLCESFSLAAVGLSEAFRLQEGESIF